MQISYTVVYTKALVHMGCQQIMSTIPNTISERKSMQRPRSGTEIQNGSSDVFSAEDVIRSEWRPIATVVSILVRGPDDQQQQ